MKRYIGSPNILGGALAILLAASVTAAAAASVATGDPDRVQTAAIEVTARGFVPDTVEIVAGVPTELVFTRTTGSGCAAQIQIPALGVERTPLPQGESVTVRFTPEEPGTYELFCGMTMFRGTIVVKPAA